MLYDGACPVCGSVAHAIRLREAYGKLHLLDARASVDDPLYQEVSRLGLDLDEGVVVFADGRFHVGPDAMVFVARFGHPTHPMTLLSRLLFQWRGSARLLYPFAVRPERCFRLRGVGRMVFLGACPGALHVTHGLATVFPKQRP